MSKKSEVGGEKMKQSDYVKEAARRCGWTIEETKVDDRNILRFTKDDLHFYNNGNASIQVNHTGLLFSEHKLIMSQILRSYNIPHVEVSAMDGGTIGDVYDHYSKNGVVDVVCKPIRGSRSVGVNKCGNFEAVMSVLEYAKEPMCLSTYVQHEAEIRVVVFRGEVRLLFPKKAIIGLRPNVLRPFDSLPKEMIEEMKEVAIRAVSCFQYTSLAVDFLVSGDNFLLIEVNTNPVLTQYSSISDENLEEVVRYTCELLTYKENLIRLEKKKR